MPNTAISGDRPLRSGAVDRLGFTEVASRIATSLVDHASDNGIVVGIDGKWGSGKSSLLYLIEAELGQLPPEKAPSVINFRPWVIGNRDNLLSSLFTALSDEIIRVELAAGDATGVSKQKAKKAGEALRKFVSGLGRTGGAIELLGDAVGFAPIRWAGKGLTALGNAVGGKPPDPPLSKLKNDLVEALAELGHRFIITIDDVDRLEPAEAVEILRLARSVADFPNVTYLLCFDGDVLAHSVEQAAGVDDGKAFLEKITQLTVMVPMPEAFSLRQWFTDELHTFASVKNDDELSRLKSVIDYEGGRQLVTPRAVVRVLDSIRFFWPPLSEIGGDLADLVWLQLIKVGNPSLYRWIEDYVATCSMISLGTVRVDEAEKKTKLEALKRSVKSMHFADMHYRYYFSEPLPGADCDYAEDGDGFELFQPVSADERDSAIRQRRIASPDHYRLYFALAAPGHALSQLELDDFWDAAGKGPGEVGEVLLRLHQHELPGNIGKADLLLERLGAAEPELITQDQSRNILLAFSRVLDVAHEERALDLDWVRTLWDRAKALIPICLARLGPDDRSRTVRAMFEDGEAVGWLTSVMRRETFAHGRYGDRPKPEADWLVSDAELDTIFDVMKARFEAMNADQLLATLRPIDILFAWRQAGDEKAPRELIEKFAKEPEGLVTALEKLTSVRNSSDRGTYSVLTRSNIEGFLNFDETRRQVTDLAASEHPMASRAAALAKAYDDDDIFG